MTLKSLSSFLQVFLPMFALFAAIGAIAGYGARQEVLIEKLLAEAEVVSIDGQYHLQQRCDETALVYRYSVDTDVTTIQGSISERLALANQQLNLPSARFAEYRTLIGSFLGGTTGGFQLRSAFKKPPGGWHRTAIQKTVIGVIASLTGYYAGHNLSSHYRTGCDSELLLTTLNDAENMVSLERARLQLNLKILQNLPDAALSLTGVAISKVEQDPAFMCSSQLQEMFEVLTTALLNTELNPDSSHFRLMDAIAELHAQIVASEEYPILLQGQLAKHESRLQEFVTAGGGLGTILAERIANWDGACTRVGQNKGDGGIYF